LEEGTATFGEVFALVFDVVGRVVILEVESLHPILKVADYHEVENLLIRSVAFFVLQTVHHRIGNEYSLRVEISHPSLLLFSYQHFSF
jgi:hypothetical protein